MLRFLSVIGGVKPQVVDFRRSGYVPRMRTGILIVAALALAGCGSQAKQAIADKMRDPDSAQFRDVKQCPSDGEVWQGEVNGKNAFGAYVGFKPFMSDGVSAGFAGDAEFDSLLKRCFGDLA